MAAAEGSGRDEVRLELQRLRRAVAGREAAEYLHVSESWVWEAVRRRQLRCTRLGRHVRLTVEHLEELIAASEQPLVGGV